MSTNNLQKSKARRYDPVHSDRLPPISAGPIRAGRSALSRPLTEREIRNAALRRQGLPVIKDDLD